MNRIFRSIYDVVECSIVSLSKLWIRSKLASVLLRDAKASNSKQPLCSRRPDLRGHQYGYAPVEPDGHRLDQAAEFGRCSHFWNEIREVNDRLQCEQVRQAFHHRTLMSWMSNSSDQRWRLS